MGKDSYVIGSKEHLGMLLDLAINRTESQGITFKREDYKWVLGVRVIHDLEESYNPTPYDRYVLELYPNKQRTLFGIALEADYKNPNNIQLWENITNKL